MVGVGVVCTVCPNVNVGPWPAGAMLARPRCASHAGRAPTGVTVWLPPQNLVTKRSARSHPAKGPSPLPHAPPDLHGDKAIEALP